MSGPMGPPVLLAVLAALPLGASLISSPPSRLRHPAACARRCRRLVASEDEFDKLHEALAVVRSLRAVEEDSIAEQLKLWLRANKDLTLKVSGVLSNEPSFTRLFTHETWSKYTGRDSLTRWVTTGLTWRFSTILRAISPICASAALWAYFVTSLPATLLPRTSPVPMSLMVTAIGLLLVFRTNNSYLRLAEARQLWGSAIVQVREVSQTVVTSLVFDRMVEQPAIARAGAARVAKYLAAWAWELNSKLTGPVGTSDTEVLMALLPAEEAVWIASQRSRPLQCLGALRRELHAQWQAGNLPTHLHWKLEEDVRELDLIVGACERIFSSPVPPTMARHIVRCLQLWLFGFPFVLAGTMAPITIAAWVFVTSYIFVGIDEVGVQVEQPFDIVPMSRICTIIMLNLEETFVRLPPGVDTTTGSAH